MKMFRKFGIIAFLTFIAFTSTSCLVRFWDGTGWETSEYPDDGIPEDQRRDVTLTFNLNGGTISTPLVNGTLTAKEGRRLSIANPTKEGYVFTGWTPSLPSRFPAQNTTYTATFNRTKDYSINYNLSGGSNSRYNPATYNINSPTITLQPATRQGYSFGGWFTDSYYRTPFSQIPSGSTGNVSVYAKWIPGMSAYRIEHWLQNANDNNYTISPNETETRTAQSDSMTNATPRYYNGFTALNINQQKVAGDGSTVVKVMYNRNLVELSFNLAGGTGTTVLRGKYGENVIAPSIPTKSGYAFAGWTPALPTTFPISNMTFYATWTVSAEPTYKVEHWQQNANNNGYTLFATTTETKISSTGGNAGTAVKNYPGFTVQSIDQSRNAADGNAVVKIYYNRNIVELNLDLDGGTGTRIIKGRYGAAVSVPSTPTKNGHTFAGWSPALPTTFPATNATYRALWTTAAVSYKVEHWQQNANDYNYTLVQNATETKAGTAGTTTVASARAFQGFTAQGVNQLTIAADGSTVVKIYYDRNIVELKFDLDGGAGMTNIQGAYGAKITAISTPKKAGFAFAGWSPALPTTFPATNATYKALWTVSTVNYKVEHYQQNATDNGYTLVKTATENKTGTAGTTTAAVARTYQGFSVQGITQLTIAADGSTVVKIYYNRNIVELTLNLDGGAGTTSLKGKFGANVTAPANPTKSGYTFNGWSPALPSTFPYQNATYKAQWKVEPAVVPATPTTPSTTTTQTTTTGGYKVEHLQQNPDDDGYTLVQTENKNGSAGSATNASAKTYNGFWSQWFQQETIAADGSTVIRIYYNRNAADLNLDLDGGTGINLIKGRYGATVYAPPEPTKAGYTFGGWHPPLPAKFPAASQVHKAIWKANTN